MQIFMAAAARHADPAEAATTTSDAPGGSRSPTPPSPLRHAVGVPVLQSSSPVQQGVAPCGGRESMAVRTSAASTERSF
jgi:hypothetical protein